jgi:AraC family transcriptional regulator
MVESWDGRSAVFAAGSLIYKPARTLHANVLEPGTGILTIEIRDAVPGMPGAFVTCRSARIRSLAKRIASELSRGAHDPASRLLVDGLGLELVAEVPRSVAPARRPCPAWLSAIRKRMAAEFRAPHTIAAYAECAGVHPHYLARLFRRHFGESIGRYLRQLRLEFAAEQLTRSSQTIGEIAAAAGFADQSHLAHAFQREYGLSPAEFRRQVMTSGSRLHHG